MLAPGNFIHVTAVTSCSANASPAAHSSFSRVSGASCTHPDRRHTADNRHGKPYGGPDCPVYLPPENTVLQSCRKTDLDGGILLSLVKPQFGKTKHNPPTFTRARGLERMINTGNNTCSCNTRHIHFTDNYKKQIQYYIYHQLHPDNTKASSYLPKSTAHRITKIIKSHCRIPRKIDPYIQQLIQKFFLGIQQLQNSLEKSSPKISTQIIPNTLLPKEPYVSSFDRTPLSFAENLPPEHWYRRPYRSESP